MYKEQTARRPVWMDWGEAIPFRSEFKRYLVKKSCLTTLRILARKQTPSPSSSVTLYHLRCSTFLLSTSHHKTDQIVICLLIVHHFLLKYKFHESQALAHFVHCYTPSTLQSIWHTKGDQVFVKSIKWKNNDGCMETAQK